jgi:hypothetical protein
MQYEYLVYVHISRDMFAVKHHQGMLSARSGVHSQFLTVALVPYSVTHEWVTCTECLSVLRFRDTSIMK